MVSKYRLTNAEKIMSDKSDDSAGEYARGISSPLAVASTQWIQNNKEFKYARHVFKCGKLSSTALKPRHAKTKIIT